MADRFCGFLFISLLVLQMSCSTTTTTSSTSAAGITALNHSSMSSYVCDMNAPFNSTRNESFDYFQAGWTLVFSVLTFLLSLVALPLVINCRVLRGHYLEKVAIQIIFVGWAKTVLITPFLVTALIFRVWFAPEYYCRLIGYWYESLTVFRIFITPAIIGGPILNALASSTFTSCFVNTQIIFAWLVAVIYGLTTTLSYFICYVYFPTLKLCSIFSTCPPLCQYHGYVWTFIIYGYGFLFPIIIYFCMCRSSDIMEAALLRELDAQEEAEDRAEEEEERRRRAMEEEGKDKDEGGEQDGEPGQGNIEQADKAEQTDLDEEEGAQGGASETVDGNGAAGASEMVDNDDAAGASETVDGNDAAGASETVDGNDAAGASEAVDGNDAAEEDTKSLEQALGEEEEFTQDGRLAEKPWLIVLFCAFLVVPTVFFFIFQHVAPTPGNATYVYQSVFGYPIFFLVPILDMIGLLTIPGVFKRVLEALMYNFHFDCVFAPCNLLVKLICFIKHGRHTVAARDETTAEDDNQEDAAIDTAYVLQDTCFVPKDAQPAVEYIQMQSLSPVVATPAFDVTEEIATTVIETPEAGPEETRPAMPEVVPEEAVEAAGAAPAKF